MQFGATSSLLNYFHLIQPQASTGVTKQTRNTATEPGQKGSRDGVKSLENVSDKQQQAELRSRQALGAQATRVVRQVAHIKMFLSSFKKDSEYVLVEIPKRPDGK